MYHKNRNYRRYVRSKAINRRRDIAVGVLNWCIWNKVIKGKLAKGKIHCSCPLCSCKSTRYYGSTDNSIKGYPKQERARIKTMKLEMQEYFNYKDTID